MTTHTEAEPARCITLDSDHALSHAGGDPELLIQLCRVFLDELPWRMEPLCSAIAANDHHRAARALPPLQNCILVFGAGHACFTAASLADALRNRRSPQIQRHWARLETQLRHLIPQVQILMLQMAIPRTPIQ